MYELNYFVDEEFLGKEAYRVQEKQTDYATSQDQDFTSLLAWQKARAVRVFAYRQVVPKLPDDERFNLSIQIRKAAVSATANIAEGYGRYHYKESIQYYRISRGSLAELKDHFISCVDARYISEVMFKEGMNLIAESRKTLNGYIRYVSSQARKG